MFVRESVMVGGRPLTLETGRLAKLADAAVLATYGESVVLVTAVSRDERPGIDFFPLTCEYVEKTYAAGKIPGGFFKREGRLRDAEVLSSRLMDRPLRPLFPDGFKKDTQIIATVLSSDKENPTDVLALSAASAALHISDIPWDGYTIDRVDLQRGPNAILFGLGSPAGVINTRTKQASYRNFGDATLRFDEYGSLRATLDLNRVLVRDELAIRFAALENESEFQRSLLIT